MEVIQHKNIDKQKKVLMAFLGLSLVFHFSVSITYLSDDFFKVANFKKPKDEKKLLIKLKSLQDSKSKQIVQTEQSKENTKSKAKFLSNKNNTFIKETKNKNVGTFKSAAKGQRRAVHTKNEVVKKITKKEKFKNIKFSDLGFKATDDLLIKKQRKVSKTQKIKRGLKFGKKDGMALGQSNDYLEDMPLGDFTKLNTQEYEFYGFYHRVKQKLEQFWGVNIKSQAEKIFKQGRSLASDSNLITGLTISLNSSGEIVDILVKSTSGIKELDEAAIKSFNQAGPFPNPPKGMLRGGKATIEWGFVVNT